MAVTDSQLREYLRLPPDTITVTGDATIDRAAFIAAVTEGGTYVFTRGDSGWTLNGTAATLSEYGIIADVAETEITVEYTTIPVDAYINAAKSKARVAGIPAFTSNAQYDLFIMALAAMYYDNRGMVFQNPADAANAQRMIDSFVLELRYAEDGEEDG
jgi:hypothetical protein